MPGFWSFDWLFGNARTGFFGDDMYGPEDGQFIIFGKYPHSRSRNRVHSSYENSRGRPISESEKKSRIEGLARVAQANYDYEMSKNKIYPYSYASSHK